MLKKGNYMKKNNIFKIVSLAIAIFAFLSVQILPNLSFADGQITDLTGTTWIFNETIDHNEVFGVGSDTGSLGGFGRTWDVNATMMAVLTGDARVWDYTNDTYTTYTIEGVCQANEIEYSSDMLNVDLYVTEISLDFMNMLDEGSDRFEIMVNRTDLIDMYVLLYAQATEQDPTDYMGQSTIFVSEMYTGNQFDWRDELVTGAGDIWTDLPCTFSRQITFTGGEDATNAELIAWMQANAVQQVAPATGVYENVSFAYFGLALSFAILGLVIFYRKARKIRCN